MVMAFSSGTAHREAGRLASEEAPGPPAPGPDTREEMLRQQCEMRLRFDVKEKMVSLAGACFWYWNSFYGFLDSSGVPRRIRDRYPRESFNKYETMRNILNDLDQAGDADTLNSLISNFFRLTGPIDQDSLDAPKAKAMLGEFREIVGDDPIELEIDRRTRQKSQEARSKSIQMHKNHQRELETLNRTFGTLVSSSEISPQKRGFELERLFFDLLENFEFECRKPYRNDGEQIDGHFRYEKFDYLVEVKWTKKAATQSDLSVFDGKIRGKAQSTRGFFLSANGFDGNAISRYSGEAPRILLMTGEDLALVLNGRITFDDAMKAKVDAIVRKGEILLALRDVAT